MHQQTQLKLNPETDILPATSVPGFSISDEVTASSGLVLTTVTSSVDNWYDQTFIVLFDHAPDGYQFQLNWKPMQLTKTV